MKTLRKLFISVIALAMVLGLNVVVSADTKTDLSDMKVYAVDENGKKTEVDMDFAPTTYTYDLTVMSNVAKIEIEATTADNTSKWIVEKEWANTRMDFGKNLTEVAVTASDGTVQKYTLNTTKLTAEEESTYKPDTKQTADNSADNPQVTKNDKDTIVTVGKKEMKISTSFSKSDIPEGFQKSSSEYKGKKYKCITGEVKNLTAFYLYDDKTEGFYIYDETADKFYPMNNIQIKSRMYTIVQPEKEDEDGILKNYEKEEITIIDQKVEAWVLDEEEGMYLIYAMNWNGDTSLYTYDDNEKCFQRYLVSLDSNRQSEAAATAYENLQKDYNSLVDKYNIILKVLCGLGILIIILIFVIINLALNKKEKKVKKAKSVTSEFSDDEDDMESIEQAGDESQENTEDDIEEQIEENIPEGQRQIFEKENGQKDEDTILNVEKPQEIEDLPEIENSDEDIDKSFDDIKEEKEETAPKHKLFGRNNANIPYGDKPTFGTEEESEEGFYGGELEAENDVLIDLTDDTIYKDNQKKIDKETENAQLEAEEDLKETLKSMLPHEQEGEDDEDDDDDFEFINLD